MMGRGVMYVGIGMEINLLSQTQGEGGHVDSCITGMRPQ